MTEKISTFNNIEVFGGDCFTNLIDIGYSLWNEAYNGGGFDAMAYSIFSLVGVMLIII